MEFCQKVSILFCALGLILFGLGFYAPTFWTFFCCVGIGTSLMQPITFAGVKIESILLILASAIINCSILIINTMVIYLNFDMTSWSIVVPLLMIYHILMIYFQSLIFKFHFDMRPSSKFYFALFVAYTFSFISKSLYPKWWANIPYSEILSEFNSICIFLNWYYYDMVVLSYLFEKD